MAVTVVAATMTIVLTMAIVVAMVIVAIARAIPASAAATARIVAIHPVGLIRCKVRIRLVVLRNAVVIRGERVEQCVKPTAFGHECLP
jgi:hypothetical protein